MCYIFATGQEAWCHVIQHIASYIYVGTPYLMGDIIKIMKTFLQKKACSNKNWKWYWRVRRCVHMLCIRKYPTFWKEHGHRIHLGINARTNCLKLKLHQFLVLSLILSLNWNSNCINLMRLLLVFSEITGSSTENDVRHRVRSQHMVAAIIVTLIITNHNYYLWNRLKSSLSYRIVKQ